MPINIQKMKSADQLSKPVVKVATKQANVLAPEEVQAVDLFVAITKAFEALSITIDGKQYSMKAANKLVEETKKYLASVAMDSKRFPLDKEAILQGTVASVVFSEQSHPREVQDMDGLIQKMKDVLGGYENLLPFIKIPLKTVDETLSEAEQKKFIKTVDGARTCKGVR